MRAGGVPPIRCPGFVAEVELGEPIALSLRGNADTGTSDSLVVLVAALHAELLALGARLVVVDIAELEFMNAAAFNVLVNWVGLIQEAPPERRYQLRFRSSLKILWQRRSLKTLSCFATDLIEIEAA